MLHILIVDDHAVLRKGLKQILTDEFPLAEVEEARDAETAWELISTREFDAVISDLTMPGRSGLELAQQVRQAYPNLPFLVLSTHPEDQFAIRAFKSGASGYLSKDIAAEELVNAVKKILQGRKYVSPSIAEKLASSVGNQTSMQQHEILSNREFEVFKQIAAGVSISDIADKLKLGVSTISTFRSRVLVKMGMACNADIVKYAVEYRLL